MRLKKKDILILIIIFIYTGILITYSNADNDLIWNYGFSYNFANHLLMYKDYNMVIELCQAGRQYNPDEMAFYYAQGMSYYMLGHNAKALDTFRSGVELANEQSNPELVSDMYAIMGDILFAANKPTQAFEVYDSCLQWKEDNIGCLNNYAY